MTTQQTEKKLLARLASRVRALYEHVDELEQHRFDMTKLRKLASNLMHLTRPAALAQLQRRRPAELDDADRQR